MDAERMAYLQDLRIVVNARSPWLLRDFLLRWTHSVGPLAPVLDVKTDEDLRVLLDELELVLRGESSHQLASQLAAPWFIARSSHHMEG